jgi:hypothetical protein
MPEFEPSREVPIVGTMTDSTGDEVRFGLLGDIVIIGCDNSPIILGEVAKQEEFAQLYIAACNQPKATGPQLADSLPDLCAFHGGEGDGHPGCPECARARAAAVLADSIASGTPLLVTED